MTKLSLHHILVSYHEATEKKTHTIAEKQILPAAIDMVSTIIYEKAAKKLKCISLSENTVSRWIIDISSNLEELDESTGVLDCTT